MWLAEPPLADVVCIYKGISSLAYWLATPMWELGKSLSFLWVYMAHARLSENLLDFSSNLPPLQLVSYSGHNSPNFKWWCWPRLSSSGPGTPCTNESCSHTVMFVGTLLNIKLGKKKRPIILESQGNVCIIGLPLRTQKKTSKKFLEQSDLCFLTLNFWDANIFIISLVYSLFKY